MNKYIQLLKKSRFSLLIISLTIWSLISIIIIHKKNEELESVKNEVGGLETKTENLEQKVKVLEEEKKDFESRIDNFESRKRNNNPTYNNLNGSEDNTRFESHGSTGKGYATVVFRKSGCDYMILENSNGYIIGEWMGGNDPDKGDNISGNFNSFGTKDFYNTTNQSDSRLWIDDYMLSKESALEKINEKCN